MEKCEHGVTMPEYCDQCKNEQSVSESPSVTGYVFTLEAAKERLNTLRNMRRERIDRGWAIDSPGYHDLEGQIQAIVWVINAMKT